MPRTKKPVATHRLTIDLSAAAFGRLQELQVKTEAATRTEVVRRALEFYRKVLDLTADGGKLYRETDSERVELVIV